MPGTHCQDGEPLLCEDELDEKWQLNQITVNIHTCAARGLTKKIRTTYINEFSLQDS